MQFAEAVPELRLGQTAHETMRRTALYAECVEKNLLTKDQPTPTKETMVLMLQAGIDMSSGVNEIGQAKAVPLSEAHLDRPVTEAALKAEIAKLMRLLPKEEVEEEKDDFLNPDKNPDTLMAEFGSIKNVMMKRSFLKNECGIDLPHKSKGEDCNQAYEKYLNGDNASPRS
jgi:hypothetical protein